MAASRREPDVSSYLRGKAHMAGVRDDTPLRTACDVLLALEVDGVPGKELQEWRRRLDRQSQKTAVPDRESWGTAPDQIAQMAKLTGTGKKPGTRGGLTAVPPPRGGVTHAPSA